MKLHVFTCGVFPSEQIAREKMWIFFASARKFGIDVSMYGNGRIFPGYRTMCHDWQVEYLKTLPPDITHVLYTEGWDVFFTGGLDEIIRKYEAMGSPQMLMSAFYQLANVSDPTTYAGLFDESVLYRYPQVGGCIAELPYITESLERMMAYPETGDNCFWQYDAWKEGWYRPMLDTNCEIFQVSDMHLKMEMSFGIDAAGNRTTEFTKRVRNMITGSHPCILHLSGGYTDQVTGKDDRLKPWARALGII